MCQKPVHSFCAHNGEHPYHHLPAYHHASAHKPDRYFPLSLNGGLILLRALVHGLLDQEVAKLGNSKVVDITKYNKALQKELEALPKGGVNTPSAKALLEKNIYRDKDGNFINKVTFSEANGLRSDILALGRDLTATDSAKYIGAQKLISGELTNAVNKATIPASLKQAYLNPKKCPVTKISNQQKILCSICLCHIKKGEMIYDTCHRFHSNCFDLWYVCQQSYPMCRKNI